tara:strand:- start:2220 stop:2789 length:570 start_codon:yes stop_codon:yes gene_type:complete
MSKNGSVEILIDPLDKNTGLKLPKSEPDVLLNTNENKPCSFCTTAQSFLITGPGEYDVKEVSVNGIGVSSTNTIYVIELEGIRICHLGLLDKELETEQAELIGDIDILMIPVGGGQGLNAKSATKIMSQIEPKITIPMHYHLPKLKEKLDNVNDFLKALGIKSLAPVSKLSIKKKDIAADEAKVIVLEP